MKARGQSCARVGVELSWTSDFSIQLTQGNFQTNPEFRASRPRPLSTGEIRVHQCELGELRWVATVSRPDICARPVQLPARVNA